MRVRFLIIGVIMLIAWQGLYADAKGQSGKIDLEFGAKIGYMIPNAETIRDIYCGGPVLGGDITAWTDQGLGAALGLDFFGSIGKPTASFSDADNTYMITMTAVTISGIYRVQLPSSPAQLYFGFGPGLYLVKETGITPLFGPDKPLGRSDSTLGMQGIAGLRFKKIIIEAKYSRAPVKYDGVAGRSTDIGGFSMFIGYRL